MKIGRKFALMTALVLVLVSAMTAYFYMEYEISEKQMDLEAEGATIGSLVEISLATNMLADKNNSRIRDILGRFESVEPINSICVVNRDGSPMASTGDHKPDDLIGPVRGINEASGRFLPEKGLYRWVQPIDNRPECFGCHEQTQQVNGAIIIDFSTKRLHESINRHIRRGAVTLTLAMLVIVSAILLMSKKLIGRRLSGLVEQTSSVMDGDYPEVISTEGNDEITRLSESFNLMVRSIQNREKAQKILIKQIQYSERKWQQTFDSITDFISIHDPEHTIIGANRAFCEHYCLTEDEVLGRKCYELVHKTDRALRCCPHTDSMKTSEIIIREIKDPASDHVYLVSIYPFHFPSDNYIGSIHVVRDITEEKQNEMRLIMTERLASLGQMSSGIAHEINNPLASIAGCAEGLMARIRTDRYSADFFTSYLRIIQEEVMRCKNITNGMLSFVRKTAYERRLLDINHLVEKTLDIISYQGRFLNVDVVRSYGEGILPVYASEGELRQALLTILTNALDAINDQGTITVETSMEDSRAVVRISDSGEGFEEGIIQRIFDPFFTTKADRGGTGLGLSIAKKIIDDNFGYIEAANSETSGAVFTLRFQTADSKDSPSTLPEGIPETEPLKDNRASEQAQ